MAAVAGASAQDSGRVAGAAGGLAIVLASIGGALVAPMWDMPATQSTAAEIQVFVKDKRPALLVAMMLHTTAVTLWFVFGAGVWLRLREASGGESFLSACFAFGLVGLGTLLLAGFTAFLVLLSRDGNVSDPRLLYDLTFGLLAMSGPLTTVALGSYAAAVFRGGSLPRWSAWLAVVAAVTHVVLLASFVVTDGFFSLEGQVITVIPGTLFVWIAATSGWMLRHPSTAWPSRSQP